MIESELEALRGNQQWQLVLESYQARHEQLQQRDPENDGWLSRITAVAGVEDERLPRIHGKLIALDLLAFQLAGRTAGVRYQLTSLGKQSLNRLSKQAEQEDGNPGELAQSA